MYNLPSRRWGISSSDPSHCSAAQLVNIAQDVSKLKMLGHSATGLLYVLSSLLLTETPKRQIKDHFLSALQIH
jgi:hypothetical protein